jgi:hypothetical protein
MFGQEPIYDIIRKNASSSASDILNALFESLNGFLAGTKLEDDITLVVIKKNVRQRFRPEAIPRINFSRIGEYMLKAHAKTESTGRLSRHPFYAFHWFPIR